MKGVMRMLMMFGPIIYRQYQKYQKNKSKEQAPQSPERHIDPKQESNR